MPTACTFSFNIAAWHAVSNRLATPEQWREWAAGRLNAQTLPEHKPALAMVIERGDAFSLALETDDSARQPESYFGALDWIRFLLSGSLKHTRQYENRRWIWNKRA